MDRSVVWINAALADLQAIYNYVHRENPVAAGKLVERFFEAGEQAAEMPGRGHRVEEWLRDDVRELSVYPFRLFYRIEEQQVKVLAVLHGSRRFPAEVRMRINGSE